MFTLLPLVHGRFKVTFDLPREITVILVSVWLSTGKESLLGPTRGVSLLSVTICSML
jgi:hypothetical protein